MTAQQRLIRPDATRFFTVCLADREGRTLIDQIDKLRAAYAITLREMPVETDAVVILPNHLHAIWTEPGVPKHAERWRRIKARFSQAVNQNLSGREAGLWQPRFFDHAILTPDDHAKAMDYCRRNPVMHGLVAQPEDWPYSSFTRRHGAVVPLAAE